jgi:hypothetical protein
MVSVRSTHWGEVRFIGSYEYMKKRDIYGDLGVNGRIMLKLILKIRLGNCALNSYGSE